MTLPVWILYTNALRRARSMTFASLVAGRPRAAALWITIGMLTLEAFEAMLDLRQ